MEALEDGFQAKLTESESCEYCIDGSGDWVSLNADTYTPTINSGHMISFRANNLRPGTYSGVGYFETSAKFNLKGNCMSMLFGDNAPYETSLEGYYRVFRSMFAYCMVVEVSDDFLPATTLDKNCYEYMFQNCTLLTKAPKLPATTLANSCYSSMFRGCTSLTTAPDLLATTLVDGCYQQMFYECNSLTKAPSIPPATTLAYDCCYGMFCGCTSLTKAPELPTTTLAPYCYRYMFSGCTSLTKAPELPATTLASFCYYGMFYGCTSLTTAPDLLATTLVDGCYQQMFDHCSSLNYIKMLATNMSSTKYSEYWVRYVASSGTFVKDSSTSISTGYNGIPIGWTVVDA